MAKFLGGIELFRRAAGLESADAIVPAAGGSGRASQRGVISAWQSGSLEKVPWMDLFGKALTPVTVAEAMRVGPMKKGRSILHSLITPRPLRAYDADLSTPIEPAKQPRWLTRTDTGISPQLRLARMLDDHIWHDATLLVVIRGAQPSGTSDPTRAPILDAVHCPRDRWRLDDDGVILVDEVPARAEQVVWIPGPSAGLLTEAADEIREWRKMRQNMGNRLDNPTPFYWLEQLDEGDLNDEEIMAMVKGFNDARKGTDAGTAFVPKGYKATAADAHDDSQLYIEGRNGLRLDIANHFNLPASVFEGSLSTASLTYSTSEGKRNEIADYGLGYWTTPIEAGLSLDNVCPRGQRIRIDFTDLFASTNAPAGAPTGD